MKLLSVVTSYYVITHKIGRTQPILHLERGGKEELNEVIGLGKGATTDKSSVKGERPLKYWSKNPRQPIKLPGETTSNVVSAPPFPLCLYFAFM